MTPSCLHNWLIGIKERSTHAIYSCRGVHQYSIKKKLTGYTALTGRTSILSIFLMNYHSDHFKNLLLLLIRIKLEINKHFTLDCQGKRLCSQQMKQQNKTTQ